ncbi:MAG: hypothetical protein G01um101491_8 [Parcubacteria group bacterium Gr01-1014_91]|nr:MAG: hypothetical protein G01um101491_8 [Parcubacteria group bacterium Gr01-1014_91]
MTHESPRAEMKRQTPKPKAEAKSEKSQAELRVALEHRLSTLKPTVDTALAEYSQALAGNTFEDKESEPEGSGEKRQTDMQNKIRVLVERAEGMRRQLDSGEDIPQTPDDEELSQANEAFMLGTFKDSWGWDTTNLKPEGHVVTPQMQNYEALSQDVDATKRGEYTLNPETQGLDFETLRAFVPDLSALNGKPVHEVIQHVVDTYGNNYHIPGIEYWKWLIENPGKNPPGSNIKDGNYYFFPGSVLRDEVGNWNVPCADWRGTEWRRGASWLTNDWNSFYRVVLLEK